MNKPATIVVIIASNLRRSKTIPMIPNAKAAGNENIISNPPRAAIGLPHPSGSTISVTIVATAMPSRAAEIFPNRIFCSPKKS